MNKKRLVLIFISVLFLFILIGCDAAETPINGISSIVKTSTDGLVDTYTITYSDNTTTTFVVTNGAQGIQGIQGEKGEDGHSPVITIGENGNWFIDGVDSTQKAQGLKGDTGNGISSIVKTSTVGLMDIYTITYTDSTTALFTVTNGAQGIQGIQGEKGEDGHSPVITIGENGNWFIDGVDTTQKSLGLKGDTGNGIASIVKTSTEGLIDTYTITYTDGSTTTFVVTNGENGIQGIQGESGEDGHSPVITIGENGNWFIDGVDTTQKAQGLKGDTGNGISSIVKTSTDGLVDTYTITFTNGSTSTFTVTNGTNYSENIQGLDFFLLDDGTYAVGVGNAMYLSNIVIPETFNNRTVTKIAPRAFGHCESLTSIAIPDSVTNIEDEAFFGCSNLTSIIIPSSVTSIGYSAFSGCSSLTIFCTVLSKPSAWDSSWNTDNCPVVWGYSDFADYTYTELGDGTISITGYTGSNTELLIPNLINGKTVSAISANAFSGNTALTSITILGSVTSIGKSAFSNCSSLTSITLPFVGSTFNGTSDVHFGYIFGASHYSYNPNHVPTNLRNVIITGGNSIGNYAFYYCNKLTSIIIPNSVINIANSAFSSCSGLTSITIPNSVTSIGDYSFSNCSGLKNLIIMNGLTSIGEHAFTLCSNLKNIVIPNSVTTIGSFAFFSCEYLTSIIIPNSVISIGSYIFTNCNFLTIYCEAQSKPSGWNTAWNNQNRPVVWEYTV